MLIKQALDIALDEVDRRKKSQTFFNDPEAWAQYMLGDILWSKQRESSLSVVENKSTAVKAGHGVGKSWLAAMLMCWWTDTRYPHGFVVSTAPSSHQVGAILWREVRTMFKQIEKRFDQGLIDHKLPGHITALNEWKDDSSKLIGFGRRPPERDEDDSMQGIHGEVLAIGDEASGLSADMIDALANITSNETSRRLLIGNPTNPVSHFAKIFKEDTGAWSLHTISVLDSPNFTEEKNELPEEMLKKLTGPQYVEDKKLEYGEDSARYKARILGEFAFDDENTLIQAKDIEPATASEIVPSSDMRPQLGVDVARMGTDKSVVYSNLGGQIRYVDSWAKAPTTETATRVHRLAIDMGADKVFVDSDGVGGGVKDQLVQMCENRYLVIEVHGSAASPDKRQWANARAWMWDTFRLRASQGNIDLDPTDEDLIDQLLTPRYKFHPQSAGLLVESKDEMRKRGVKSPDLADSAVYASIEVDLGEDDPLAQYSPGDKVFTSADDVIGNMPEYLAILDQY